MIADEMEIARYQADLFDEAEEEAAPPRRPESGAGAPDPAFPGSGEHGCLSINWPEAPPELGIAPTEQPLFTFDGALVDRHPPTAPGRDESGNPIPGREGVRLPTWGEPYLQRCLESLAEGDISL